MDNKILLYKFNQIKQQNSIKRKYSKEGLIKNIQEKAKELGRNPQAQEMQNPSANIYRAYFTYWEDALIEAGLTIPKRLDEIYTDDELINILLNKYNENGKIPKVKDFSTSIYVLYVKRFGGLKNALEVAQLIPPKSIKTKKGNSKNMENYNLMLTMRKDGKSFREIGQVLGVSKQRVHKMYQTINR